MENKNYEIESAKPFCDSLIWQLNRDYYHQAGPGAWRYGTVPRHLTSNSMVGKTYAELAFAFLKDLAAKGQVKDTVYMLELGAGHGSLAFHILKHLEKIMRRTDQALPPFCYILSDIVEENLNFFQSHQQFQPFFAAGLLDVAHFDGIGGRELKLRHSDKTIGTGSLTQPLLVVANYFFDSIPNDLFFFKDKKIAPCFVSLESDRQPDGMDAEELLQNLKLSFFKPFREGPHYEKSALNEILESYREQISDSHLFFPQKGLQCIDNLRQLSSKGLVLLSMDKGFHEMQDLEKVQEPEIITHGSFSIWVNYHAYGAYCEKTGGLAFFPAHSTVHLVLGCLLFVPDAETFTETKAAYERVVNDFGPDDFNSLKKHSYQNRSKMELLELIALLRLSAYDSIYFKNMLPQIKQLSGRVTFQQRRRLAETMHEVWNMYFTIYEAEDLAYEIGGLFYDMGFYADALDYFQYSIDLFGQQADVFYNRALCYYQLREDQLFLKTMLTAKAHFPDNEKLAQLDKLDLGAA